MRNVVITSLLPLLAAGSPFLAETIHRDAAPIVSSVNAEDIPNSYMVVFKKHVTDKDANAHHSWVQEVHVDAQNQKMELRKRSQMSFQETFFEGLKHTYNIPGGLLGYSGHFDEDVIEMVRRHPDVSQSIPTSPFPYSIHLKLLHELITAFQTLFGGSISFASSLYQLIIDDD